MGQLAYRIASYDLAHGNRDNGGPMQQLGEDYLQLAEGICEQRAVKLEHRDALLPGGILAEEKVANANER